MASKFGRVRQRSDTGAWYVDVRPYGRIQWLLVEGVGKKPLDEGLAQMLLSWIRAEIAAGKSAKEAVDPYLPRPTATVAEKLPGWLERMATKVDAGQRSPTYLRELLRYAREDSYFEPLKDRSIYSINYADLEDWLFWLQRRGLSAKTQQNALAAFRSFLGDLKRRGEISSIPAFPDISVEPHVPRVIPPDAQDAILEAIPRPRRGAFIAAVELLLRPGEIRALNVEDYDRRTRMLTIAHAIKGPTAGAPRRGTKEADIRMREVSARLHEWIDDHVPLLTLHEGERPLFQNPGGRTLNKRWTSKSLRAEWGRAAERAGWAGVGLYEGTKHSTATALRRAGVALDVIQAAAGHKDIRSTERYAQLANSVVTEALKMRR